MEDVLFLTLAEIVEVHTDQVERYGGAKGIRDLGLLESALAIPAATFEEERLPADLYEIAAAYAFHLSHNHPSIDGNKRTALACALVFLELNGISLLDPEGRLYQTMMEVASGRLDKQELAELFRALPQGSKGVAVDGGIRLWTRGVS